MPIKEVPSTTKPVGKPGDERQFTQKDRSVREHPFKNQGYKGVGSQSKSKGNGAEREPSAIPKKQPEKEHSHKNEGYKSVGKGDGTDARKYTTKSPFKK